MSIWSRVQPNSTDRRSWTSASAKCLVGPRCSDPMSMSVWMKSGNLRGAETKLGFGGPVQFLGGNQRLADRFGWVSNH